MGVPLTLTQIPDETHLPRSSPWRPWPPAFPPQPKQPSRPTPSTPSIRRSASRSAIFSPRCQAGFTKFSGTITVDRDNLENSSVGAEIDMGSVDTDNDKRDAHLKITGLF